MATPQHDAALPMPLMKVLPDDPYEQLELAKKITSLALASRVSALEARLGQLRHTLDLKDGTIADLQQRIAEADQAVQKTSIKILKTTDDQIRLSKENEKLQESIFKLKHDVSKMESFRKSLVHTLRLDKTIAEAIEEDAAAVSPPRTTTRSMLSYSNSPKSPPPPHRVPGKAETYLKVEDDMYLNRPQYSADDDGRRMLLFKSRQGRKSMSDMNAIELYNPPDSALRRGSSFNPPQRSSSPPKREARTSLPSPAQRSLALINVAISPEGGSPTSSPPRAKSAQASPRRKKLTTPASPFIPFPTPPAQISPPRSPSMQMTNGKEFFRQAKNRLSYDGFRALLTTIKDLNFHKLTREDALRNAQEIFGNDNQDLYTFLDQHLPS